MRKRVADKSTESCLISQRGERFGLTELKLSAENEINRIFTFSPSLSLTCYRHILSVSARKTSHKAQQQRSNWPTVIPTWPASNLNTRYISSIPRYILKRLSSSNWLPCLLILHRRSGPRSVSGYHILCLVPFLLFYHSDLEVAVQRCTVGVHLWILDRNMHFGEVTSFCYIWDMILYPLLPVFLIDRVLVATCRHF